MPVYDVQIKPEVFPTEILDKDWSTRLCYVENNNNKQIEATKMVQNFEVREDDVWIVTLPKSGTTWMQELAWLVANDFDIESAKKECLEIRSPFIEFDISYEGKKALEKFEKLKSPRIFKTHLAFPLLPTQLWTKKPKTIYVFRDPKDALVSFYHFGKVVGLYKDVGLTEVIENDLEFELETNNIFNHALEFYALRNEPWVYYTSYERMKANLSQVLLDVCSFLGKTITDEQMSQMLTHLSFEEMKKNPSVNHVMEIKNLRKLRNLPALEDNSAFVRKGKVGSAREELSMDLLKRMNVWVEDTLRPYNLSLKDLLLQE